MSYDSFADILSGLFSYGGRRGGGRRPHEANMAALDNDEETWLQPSEDPRLTIIQITDVYTLDNFASLKTLQAKIRQAQGPNAQVVSMLTGDFLAPYLLSSIDNGEGMMMAINETPIDILTWGNHEADIPHKHGTMDNRRRSCIALIRFWIPHLSFFRLCSPNLSPHTNPSLICTVCKHMKNFKGTMINTNMQSHDSMKYDCSVPYKIVKVTSPDGKHTHKIGFLGLLSNDPKLYSHFKTPAFGGATIEDPWETLGHYKKLLEEEEGCDLVVPLEHLYVHENEKTCQLYKEDGSIPLILSGHDHHRIDTIIEKTRLIKPGMDGVHAAVIEIVFDKNDASAKPRIRSSFVEMANFEPDPELKVNTDAAYNVLLPLRNTMLAQVLPQFFPLTSKNARGSVTTMGKLICSMLKQALLQEYYAATEDFQQ